MNQISRIVARQIAGEGHQQFLVHIIDDRVIANWNSDDSIPHRRLQRIGFLENPILSALFLRCCAFKATGLVRVLFGRFQSHSGLLGDRQVTGLKKKRPVQKLTGLPPAAAARCRSSVCFNQRRFRRQLFP
jgi:hypothetical protein